MKLSSLLIIFLLNACNLSEQKTKSFDVQSPDGNIKLHVAITNKIVWSVKDNDAPVIEPSSAAMQLQNEVLGDNSIITSSKTETVNNAITPINYIKSTITDNYNQLTINCKNDYGIIFRVYNDAVAYRFFT